LIRARHSSTRTTPTAAPVVGPRRVHARGVTSPAASLGHPRRAPRTAPSEPALKADPIDPALHRDARLPADAMDPTDPADQAERSEPAEPTDNTDSTEPLDPIDRRLLWDHNDHLEWDIAPPSTATSPLPGLPSPWSAAFSHGFPAHRAPRVPSSGSPQ